MGMVYSKPESVDEKAASSNSTRSIKQEPTSMSIASETRSSFPFDPSPLRALLKSSQHPRHIHFMQLGSELGPSLFLAWRIGARPS